MHVQGSSLDLRQYTVNTRVGGTAAAMSEWVSSSALLCKVAAGTKDANGVVVVTAGSVAASSRRLFSYDAPSISGVEKADSPGSASLKVWMHGENFGASDVTARARLGGLTLCPSLLSSVRVSLTLSRSHSLTLSPSHFHTVTGSCVGRFSVASILPPRRQNNVSTPKIIFWSHVWSITSRR